MGTKPPSPAPDVEQIGYSLCKCRKMPSPTEVGHQEKEKDVEREALTESH